MIPGDVNVLITRDYGETANDKVNELVSELTLAMIIVVGLIAFCPGLARSADRGGWPCRSPSP